MRRRNPTGRRTRIWSASRSGTAGAAESFHRTREEFLAGGEPPVIFTPGSAGATMHRYFRESVAAARELGVRAMLVTNFPDQVPATFRRT